MDREHGACVELCNRRNLRVTGVKNVINYCETTVTLSLDESLFTVDGEGLNIIKLNLDNGEVVIEGLVYAMNYSDGEERRKGFFGKLFG